MFVRFHPPAKSRGLPADRVKFFACVIKMVSLIELKHLADDIKEHTLGKRIDKIYVKYDIFIIKTTSGNINIMLPDFIIFSEQKVKAGFKVGNLCTYLRKHLKGKIIKNVEIVNFDRIVRIQCNDYTIYIELFSKGNFILCDSNDKILAAYKYEERKGRNIKKQNKYCPPTNINPLDYSRSDEVYQRLKEIDPLEKQPEKTLAGIGIPRDLIKEKEYNQISQSISHFWCDGLPSDYVETVRSQLENIFLENITKDDAKFNSNEVKKLDKIINSQEKKVKENLDKIKKITNTLDFINKNYEIFEKLLENAPKNITGFEEFKDVKDIENKLNLKIKIKYPMILFKPK